MTIISFVIITIVMMFMGKFRHLVGGGGGADVRGLERGRGHG